MQFPIVLIESFKSGKVTISQNNVPQVEIETKNKKMNLNIKDKKLIKEVLTSIEKDDKKGLKKPFGISPFKTIQEASPMLKDAVESLCRRNITIYVKYKNDKVLTMGSEADSKLTRLVTGTKGIEINNPIKLAELTI